MPLMELHKKLCPANAIKNRATEENAFKIHAFKNRATEENTFKFTHSKFSQLKKTHSNSRIQNRATEENAFKIHAFKIHVFKNYKSKENQIC